MSDIIDRLGVSISLSRPGEDMDRAAAVRFALARRSANPGSATVLPLPRAAGRTLHVVTLSRHTYGLVGPYLVIRSRLNDGPLEVEIHSDEERRTVAAFSPTAEGYREADACARGAIEALKIVVGFPVTPDPNRAA